MIRLKITMNNGQFVTRDCQNQQEADEYLDYIQSNYNWGKPEHWSVSEPEDISNILDTRIIIDSEVVEELLDENLNVIHEAIPEVSHVEYLIRSEYSVEIIDISAQLELENQSREALVYLKSTDYKILKAMELGLELDPETKSLRAAARLKVI